MAVRLEDVTGGKLAITLAMSLDPRWTGTRFKTTKLASDLALDIAKQRATAYFYELVHGKLLEAWQRFVFVNGARPNTQGPDADEWDSGLDDELYAMFEPHAHMVSANWLGTVSDSTPTEVAHVHRLAESFAAECWSQVTYQRTPNQTLAGVGIVLDDLQAFVLSHAETQEKPMSLNDIFNKIMLNFVDEDQLESLLDDASDDDEGVRASGAAQLGITTDDADRLAAVRAEGGSVIEGWMHMINMGVMLPVETEPAPASVPPPPVSHPLELPAALVRNTMPEVPPPPSSGVASVGTVPPPPPQRGNGTVPPPPPGVNAPVVTSTGAPPPEPPPVKRGRKPKVPEGPPPGTVPASALVAIKAASGLKDEDFAVKLNVSRPTFNNYLRSKGFCIPTPAQREELLALVDSKIAELTEARATLVV